MLRRIALIATVCVAAFMAHAQKVGVPYSLTANGTTKDVQALDNVAASDTNWVTLAGMIVTVPPLSTGVVEVTAHVLGTNAPAAFSQRLVNTRTVTDVRFIAAVFGTERSDLGLMLYGTNSLLSVTKTGAATNEWPIVLLLDQ